MSELIKQAIHGVMDENGFLPDGSQMMIDGVPLNRASFYQLTLDNGWANDDSIYDYLAMLGDYD
jgi:hypothetical protein